MQVIDHEPHAWFLLRDENQFYLDVHCSHSAFDYTVLIALNAEESALFEQQGRDYLHRLAHDIHYTAPAMRGSTSPYRPRNLTVPPSAENDAAQAAITQWVKASRS